MYLGIDVLVQLWEECENTDRRRGGFRAARMMPVQQAAGGQ